MHINIRNNYILNKEKKNKQHKKYRDIKCSNCRSVIDISEKIELGDVDYLEGDKTKAVFYCDKCGSSTSIIKL
jgi:DNA-directed RNA polymerase subunit RPC12/RpoP